jgi:Phage tail assembly chaperone protein, TAC
MSESIGPAALGLYSIAARLLAWRPSDFWSATPAELIAALSPPGQPAALDRSELNRMMEQDNG